MATKDEIIERQQKTSFLLGVCVFAMIVICVLILVNIPSSNNQITSDNRTVMLGNCIFPLKLYNNMTALQIENASIICYK